jgi:hypothetical protein
MYEFSINVAFPKKRVDITEYYDRMFKMMAQQDITVCRIWLSDFSFNCYDYRGSKYDVNMEQLERVIALAGTHSIRFVLVLFDFNEFTTTNIHWSNYEHTFLTSYPGRYLTQPNKFFLPKYFDMGVSKLNIVRKLFSDDALWAWELFNEVDLIKDYNPQRVSEWAHDYSKEIRKFSVKPIYISFASPKHVDEAVRLMSTVKVSLHVYQWPYVELYKSIIFWQAKYPSHWIMECGSASATAQEMIVGLIASTLLSEQRLVAMPWFWEHILGLGIYRDVKSIVDFIAAHTNETDRFQFMGSLGSNKRKINLGDLRKSWRASGLKSLLFKAAVTAKTMTTKAKPGCVLRFESERILVAIETEFTERVEICANDFTLLDACYVNGMRVTLYTKATQRSNQNKVALVTASHGARSPQPSQAPR